MANSDSDDPINNRYEPRGVAQRFDRTKYAVETAMFPADLMRDQNNEYGGNYVIFYISVHHDSYLFREGKARAVYGNITPADKTTLAGKSEAATDATAKAMVAGIGLGGAAVGSYAINKLGIKANPLVENAAALVAGGVIGAAAYDAYGTAKASMNTLQQVIALHMPTDVIVRYSTSWEEDSMVGTHIMADAANAIMGALSGSTGKGPLSSVAAAAITSLGARAPGNITGGLQKLTGVAPNPKKEQIFDRVDFRTFTFTYDFSPKSEQEAASVREIIKKFKLHMHPEYKKDSGAYMFLYPSEFDILYYHNDKENMNIHRHTSCVLTDMNVSYTPQGQFVAFEDGMPAQVRMTLTFKELAALTKESIEDGF